MKAGYKPREIDTADGFAQTLKNLVDLSPGSTLEIADGMDDGLDLTLVTANGYAIDGVWLDGETTDEELLLELEQLACDIADSLERIKQARW